MDDKTGPPSDLASAMTVGGVWRGSGVQSAEIVVHSVASPPTALAH
ncbi:MAG TPA: hypothetical protein VN880_18405 [Solirubrobacteraceae bacterium]|jgi:hypothetical protein|nr:hypothetical protein [Solirubrobacteraceae bacterium]